MRFARMQGSDGGPVHPSASRCICAERMHPCPAPRPARSRRGAPHGRTEAEDEAGATEASHAHTHQPRWQDRGPARGAGLDQGESGRGDRPLLHRGQPGSPPAAAPGAKARRVGHIGPGGSCREPLTRRFAPPPAVTWNRTPTKWKSRRNGSKHHGRRRGSGRTEAPCAVPADGDSIGLGSGVHPRRKNDLHRLR